MKIFNSTILDIESIFGLYKIATEYQKPRFKVQWPEFDRALVETEIKENRQWKLISDNEIACVWATTFTDPLIWEEKNEAPAVYIHRIAVSPNFRGQNLVLLIAEWAKRYASQNNKTFVRLDTIGDNIKLIEHYQKCGFTFLGVLKLKNTDGLPAHYHNAEVSLFEMQAN